MSTNRLYRIEGKVFSHDQLLEYCRNMAGEPDNDQDGNTLFPPWKRQVYAFIRQFMDEGSGPITQRTSGTTGDPKKYELDRGAMVVSARKTLDFFSLKPGDRVLLCLPVEYIAGKMVVVRALVGGLDLVMSEPSGRPLQSVDGHFRFASMVPLQLFESLQAGDDLSRTGKLLVGGGELHPAVRSRLEGMNRPEVFESFAMTETYTHFALRRINGPRPDRDFHLLKGVSIRTDERGCLVVDVPGVTAGAVVTNDLVEIGGDGASFRWLGRIDNVIKTGGIKVIPELLEKRIGALLEQECLILPGADEKLGRKIILLVEYPGANPPLEAWTGLLRRHLSAHENPRQLIPVREIPRNASFKPDRMAALKMVSSMDSGIFPENSFGIH